MDSGSPIPVRGGQEEAPSITVLMPAHNEADRVGESVRGVIAALAQIPTHRAEILVIDDGSTDGTADHARKAGAGRVARLDPNRGKGGALNAGVQQSTGEILVMVDADVGESAVEIAKLVGPVIRGEADMTIAGFPTAGRSGGFGLALRLARWAVRRSTGQEISAPLSGQRALRREVVEAIGGFESGFGAETGLTLDALRRGYRVLVVPTTMKHRALGRSVRGFVHRGRQLWHIARVIWRKRAWAAGRTR